MGCTFKGGYMAWKCPHCKTQVSDVHHRCTKCRREKPSANRPSDDDDGPDLLDVAVGVGLALSLGDSDGVASGLDDLTGGGGDFGGGGSDG